MISQHTKRTSPSVAAQLVAGALRASRFRSMRTFMHCSLAAQVRHAPRAAPRDADAMANGFPNTTDQRRPSGTCTRIQLHAAAPRAHA